jgi:hypothetical protein
MSMFLSSLRGLKKHELGLPDWEADFMNQRVVDQITACRPARQVV